MITKKLALGLLLAAFLLGCNGNSTLKPSNTEQSVDSVITPTKEELQATRQNAIRDSISENYSLACENNGNLFFFKGKPQHYKRFLYIYNLDAEKCDSLRDAFPVIFDFYTTKVNRIVMIEHDPHAGEGSLGAFASTAPQFYVDEYNTETGKIRCLVNGCTSAEFVDKNSSNHECSLKIGDLIVLNSDACSADMEFDIKYRIIKIDK